MLTYSVVYLVFGSAFGEKDETTIPRTLLAAVAVTFLHCPSLTSIFPRNQHSAPKRSITPIILRWQLPTLSGAHFLGCKIQQEEETTGPLFNVFRAKINEREA